MSTGEAPRPSSITGNDNKEVAICRESAMFHGSTVWVRAPRFHAAGRRRGNATRLSKWFRPTHGHPGKEFRVDVPSHPIMAQEQAIEVEGKITSVLAGTMFHVELANKHTVLAHISGKMRKRFIRLTNGDRVKMEMSPYDLSKARIVYRLG
jgi:translation initiation factor IF-1